MLPALLLPDVAEQRNFVWGVSLLSSMFDDLITIYLINGKDIANVCFLLWMTSMNQYLNIVPVRLYLHCKGSSELPILVFFRFFCLMMWNPFSCLNLRENVYEQSP